MADYKRASNGKKVEVDHQISIAKITVVGTIIATLCTVMGSVITTYLANAKGVKQETAPIVPAAAMDQKTADVILAIIQANQQNDEAKLNAFKDEITRLATSTNPAYPPPIEKTAPQTVIESAPKAKLTEESGVSAQTEATI